MDRKTITPAPDEVYLLHYDPKNQRFTLRTLRKKSTGPKN